jgi:PAS domain S-box-containing protein
MIKILDPVPTDPFAAPARNIASISTFEHGLRAAHRVKVRGTVTLILPEIGFYLQDNSGGIRVSTSQTNSPRMGDLVETLGFTAMGEFTPALEDASFRILATGQVPQAQPATAEELLRQGQYDGQRVKLKANLAQKVLHSARPRLVLQDGPIIFTANLQSQDPERTLERMQPGSVVSLQGVCSVLGGPRHEAEAFRLLVASPRDIALLQVPSWWTTGRFLSVIGCLLLAVCLSLAWIYSLRSRVQAQTQVIHQKLQERDHIAAVLRENERKLRLIAENTTDFIFAFDMNRQLVFVNAVLKDFCGYAFDEIQAGSFFNRIHPDDRERVRKHWEALYVGQNYSEFEFRLITKSGQMKWCAGIYGPLLDEAGRQIGVQGRERDISERKWLENQLLEISAKERRHLGHELHDGLGQFLAGIALKAKLLEEQLAEDNSSRTGQSKAVVELINDAIRQTRNLAHGLDPVHVEVNGLISALDKLAAQTKELFHVNCSFNCRQERLDITPEGSLALYRITQEAIHNAIVHGHSRRIEVGLDAPDKLLCLTIQDYGEGFPSELPANAGMGLHVMHYRARSIGGNLAIESIPNKGTLVACRVPLDFCLVKAEGSSSPHQAPLKPSTRNGESG